ncbi:twin-arginine translocase subunit TatC [Chloroflexota bacterium]
MSKDDSKPTSQVSNKKRQMNFWQHLEELRVRLRRAVIGVVIGTVIGAIFTNQMLEILLLPMGDVVPVALHPTESFVVYFRVALLGGVVVAMPYILFQILAFLVPGLTRGERSALFLSLLAISLFFALGVGFSGLVMVPLAVKYLSGFLSDVVQPTYSIDSYISFVTTLMFSTGLVFETPLLMALIARIGLITSKQLAQGRRYALLIIAVLAAVITPTPDAFNMMIVMAPLLVLYEVGIVLAWFSGRARAKALMAATD